MTTTKNAMISAKLVELMQGGMDIKQAFDTVFGEGAYNKLAGEIYEALHAK